MQNRRSKVRYPISLPVKFTVRSKKDQKTGFGTLIDISSKAVAIRAEGGLQPGMKVSASIGWPAMLGNECALQLCFDGHVVRVDGSLVAVSIDRYDFRTAANERLRISTRFFRLTLQAGLCKAKGTASKFLI
jgi:c-di-GMP-binding flagellar brake protein YcgR